MTVHCSETGSAPLENPTQYIRVDDTRTTYMAIFRTSQLNKTMVASRKPDLSNRKKKNNPTLILEVGKPLSLSKDVMPWVCLYVMDSV